MDSIYEEHVRLTGGHTAGIAAAAFSPHGKLLATAGLDGNLCIWDVSGGDLVHVHQGNSAALSISWMPEDEDSLQYGTEDGYLVNLIISQELSRMTVHVMWAHKFPIECLDVHDNLVASGAHNEVAVWERRPEARWIRRGTIECPPSAFIDNLRPLIATSVQWVVESGTATLLFVAYMDHQAHFFETSNWSCVRTITTDHRIARANISPDSRFLAISDLAHGFTMYDCQSGGLMRRFIHEVGKRYPVPVFFIHQGHAIVGGSTVGRVNIWDIEDGRRIEALDIPGEEAVLAIAVHRSQGSNRTFIATAVTLIGDSPFRCIVWSSSTSATEPGNRVKDISASLPEGRNNRDPSTSDETSASIADNVAEYSALMLILQRGLWVAYAVIVFCVAFSVFASVGSFASLPQ